MVGLLTWVVALGGAKKRALAETLLFIAAVWAFGSIVSYEWVRRLSRHRKAAVWSLSAVVICAIWLVARHNLLPQEEPTIEQIAEQAADAALRKRAVQQPRFALVYRNCASDIGPVECLEIWNRGGNVRSFQVHHYAALSLLHPERRSIPVVPTYYFYGRRTTGRKSGKLITLTAAFRDKNSRWEFDRIFSEAEKEWGEWWGPLLRLFIQVDYVDLAGSAQQISYELKPHERFTPPAILEYKVSDTLGPHMVHAQALWELTASKLLANWDHYPSSLEVFPREFRGDE